MPVFARVLLRHSLNQIKIANSRQRLLPPGSRKEGIIGPASAVSTHLPLVADMMKELITNMSTRRGPRLL
jgi:hypothetical protein